MSKKKKKNKQVKTLVVVQINQLENFFCEKKKKTICDGQKKRAICTNVCTAKLYNNYYLYKAIFFSPYDFLFFNNLSK